MFNWFKNKCNHQWYLLYKNEEDVIKYNGIDIDIDYEKVAYCYCPECKTRERVSLLEWELREKQCEIDIKHRNKKSFR